MGPGVQLSMMSRRWEMSSADSMSSPGGSGDACEVYVSPSDGRGTVGFVMYVELHAGGRGGDHCAG